MARVLSRKVVAIVHFKVVEYRNYGHCNLICLPPANGSFSLAQQRHNYLGELGIFTQYVYIYMHLLL